MGNRHIGIRAQLGIDLTSVECREMLGKVDSNPLVERAIDPDEAHLTLISLYETGHPYSHSVDRRLGDAMAEIGQEIDASDWKTAELQTKGDRIARLGDRLIVPLVTCDYLSDVRERSKSVLIKHGVAEGVKTFRPHVSLTPRLLTTSAKRARARSKSVSIPDTLSVTGFSVGKHDTRKVRQSKDPTKGYINRPNGRTR